MANRTSLKDRLANDARGVDAIISASEEAPGITRESQKSTPPALAKATVYIRPDQILAIEEIQVEERKRTGNKPDKSDLMQEALDLLVKKYRKA